ncbi:MAG: alpha/beta hydrolase fold domain-containing protein [Clostridia bacterium]|nr:alpha/beta hydrolase fold domain-containing protein [Clostridia bacterium]
MPLTPELRARMARDMQSNRKFDGDTDIPEECRAFADLAVMETVERPAVCGWPYKLYIFTAKNKKPGSPLHVNIHGGGWLIGHMPNDTLWSAWLADQIGGVVVDVDYTTTEFASFPVPMEQCLDAARYAFDHVKEWNCDPARVSCGGYSAGGQLTMSIAACSRMRGEPLPFCLLVNGYGPNEMRYDAAAIRNVPEYWRTQEFRHAGFAVLMSDDDPAMMSDPAIDFMMAPEAALTALPPTMILGAARDTLRFQNLEQGKRLAALGVEVTMKVFPDTSHGFIPHFMPHWQEAGEMIVKAIQNTSLQG